MKNILPLPISHDEIFKRFSNPAPMGIVFFVFVFSLIPTVILGFLSKSFIHGFLVLALAVALILPLTLNFFPFEGVFTFAFPAVASLTVFFFLATLGMKGAWDGGYAMPISLVEYRMVSVVVLSAIIAVSGTLNILVANFAGHLAGPFLDLATMVLLCSTFLIAKINNEKRIFDMTSFLN